MPVVYLYLRKTVFKMYEEDADVVIAATCLMLSCSAQVAITAMRKEHKSRRSTWVRSYLRKRNVYSVYTALPPDFRQLHRQKFRNFLRMDVDTLISGVGFRGQAL